MRIGGIRKPLSTKPEAILDMFLVLGFAFAFCVCCLFPIPACFPGRPRPSIEPTGILATS